MDQLPRRNHVDMHYLYLTEAVNNHSRESITKNLFGPDQHKIS